MFPTAQLKGVVKGYQKSKVLEMPQFRILARFTLLTIVAMAVCFPFDCNAGQVPEGAPPTAVLKNMGGAVQGLAGWFPGGPPIAFLDLIDGKEPKDFGLKGADCIKHRGGPKTCSFGEKFQVTLAEGQHSLHVWFHQNGYNNTSMTTKPMDLSFVAGSGHVYVVQCIAGNGGWVPVVVDVTDKAHPHLAVTP